MDRQMSRQVGPAAWFAAAGGLATMAVLAAVGFGLIAQGRADGRGAGATAGASDALAAAAAPFGWGVLALVGIAVLDIVVAWGLWGVFQAERPGGAALAAAFRVVYAAVFLGAIAMLVDARNIATGVGATSDLAIDDRDTAVLLRFEGFDSAWNTGLLVFGVHLAVVGWLLVARSGAFATVVGWLVLIAGAGYLADGVFRVVAPDVAVSISQFTFVGEVVLIGWLVVGGIRAMRAHRASRPGRRRIHARVIASTGSSAARRERAPFGRSMSYEEKGTWVYLVVSVTGYAVYLSLVLPQLLAGTPVDEIDYVPAMLWTIGGAIVAAIIGRILVEIVSPSESTKGDIRDKEIDRLGERVGNSFVVIGALGALVLAMFDADGFWIANTVYFCFVLSAILSSVTRLIAYRRGVPTW